MFVQIVITKVDNDKYKVTYHDADKVVYSDTMSARDIQATIFTSLLNLVEAPNATSS